jgi:ferritin-like metal-binding protein YciE
LDDLDAQLGPTQPVEAFEEVLQEEEKTDE